MFRSGYVWIIGTGVLSTAIPHRTHPVSSAPGALHNFIFELEVLPKIGEAWDRIDSFGIS